MEYAEDIEGKINNKNCQKRKIEDGSWAAQADGVQIHCGVLRPVLQTGFSHFVFNPDLVQVPDKKKSPFLLITFRREIKCWDRQVYTDAFFSLPVRYMWCLRGIQRTVLAIRSKMSPGTLTVHLCSPCVICSVLPPDMPVEFITAKPSPPVGKCINLHGTLILTSNTIAP